MKNIFVNERITHVYHAAAYKHVNLSEKNITECVYNNIFGIINVINSIPKSLESFTLISTDKAAAPSSVMGMTKRMSEIICQNELHKNKTKTRLSIVRFGNVFGSNGSAIQIFLKQIENKEPITITDKKVERYFMTVEEACILVLNSSFLRSDNGIYVLNMGKSIKIKKIVDDLIYNFGDKNHNYKINYIGLNKGEKLKEILSISNKKYKTKYKNIFKFYEPIYKDKLIQNLISNLNKDYLKGSNQNLKKHLSNFLSKELYYE